MKVTEILRKGETAPISIEIEPPILGKSINHVFKALDRLVEVGTRYVNITYHAEQVVGYTEENNEIFPISQKRKPGTVGVAGAIQTRYASRQIQAVPHVICTSFTKYDAEEYLIELGFLGVKNVMALRGDPVPAVGGAKTAFKSVPAGYSHANELIEQIVNLRRGLYVGAREGDAIDFCIGAACYPEGHPESTSPEDDLRWAKAKVEAGADYLVTQMFLDNSVYKRFVEKARKRGINVPIVAGIKPLTSRRHLETLPSIFHCSVPEELRAAVHNQGENEENIRNVGIEWCVKQCKDLISYGVPGIHFYASRASPVREVVERIL